MIDKYQKIKNKILIGFLFGVSKNTDDIEFNKNIKLVRTSDDDKDKFVEHNADLADKEVVTHCLKFIIDDYFVKEIGEQIDEKTLKENSASNWEDLEPDFLESYVIDKASWQLIKLVEAINISKTNPVQLLSLELYDDEYLDDLCGDCCPEHYIEVLGDCVIETGDIKSILKILSLLLKADHGLNQTKDSKRYWWIVTVEFFTKYSESHLTTDQVIDLTIALESLLSGPGENLEMRYRLSQRASLYLYDIGGYYPNQIQDIVKKMYDARSKIVHGSKALRSPEDEKITLKEYQVKIGDEEHVHEKIEIYLDNVLDVLREILRLMLFDAMFNHADKSKEEFLDYIDTIWQVFSDINHVNWIM